jgi:hypothetical protein
LTLLNTTCEKPSFNRQTRRREKAAMDSEQLRRKRSRAGRITVVLAACIAAFVIVALAFQGGI